jgi:signal transduction histidine kinase/ActR/RegA family two-component response regulator
MNFGGNPTCDPLGSAPPAEAAARTSAHIVQFYDDDAFLVETVASFIASGLADGTAAVIIATKSHLEGIEERLKARAIDTAVAQAQGHYVQLDAAATLSMIMKDGELAERRFHEIIDGAITEASRGGARRVRAFGEMVALLSAARDWKAVIRLEELWTDLCRRQPLSLLCAYPMSDFGQARDARPFLQVCSNHTRVRPTDAYATLLSGAERLRLIAHLQQKSAALETALAERSELLEREQAARAAADAASRMKDEFLATLSHELRTPLNAILGWIQMLRADRLDQAATDRAVAVIERNTQTLGALVSDILDVSRIITGKMTLQIADVDLVQLIDAVVDSLRPAAAAKHLAVDTCFAGDPRPLAGDTARLQQVIWNLVSNAVKFTPPGGRVEIGVEWLTHGVRLTVTDTGQGIAPEFLPLVFDRFQQADSTDSRANTGLGLGLAIVRQLVELHGGTVRAESAGEGEGATFVVELPSRGPAPGAVGSARRSAQAEATWGAMPAGALKGCRVLIVDDNGDTCDLFAALLQEQGAEAAVATSAAAALGELRRQLPDLILCDIAMPDTDGFGLIHEIRSPSAPAQDRIPAIALTGYAQPGDRDRVLAAGFDAYVTKPVEPAVLIEIVAETIAKARRS